MISRMPLVLGAAVLSSMPLEFVYAADVSAVASLLDRYPKGEIIRSVVTRCGGDISVAEPPGARVYGRPREDLVTAETISADLQRCGIALDTLEREVDEAVNWSGPKGKVYRKKDPSSATNLAIAKQKREKEKRRRLKAEEQQQREAAREATREAERRQRDARKAEQVAAYEAERERREAELAKRRCDAAKERRDEFYDRVYDTSYPKSRQRYRDLYEKERAWIRRNC